MEAMVEKMEEMVETASPDLIGEKIPMRRRALRSTAARTAMLIVVVLAAIGAYFAWRYYSVRESTDDAQVEGHIHPISPQVGGIVVTVNIKENQPVQTGAILVQIDPRDYQVALERAKADL